MAVINSAVIYASILLQEDIMGIVRKYQSPGHWQDGQRNAVANSFVAKLPKIQGEKQQMIIGIT